jgi:hypothetical protein
MTLNKITTVLIFMASLLALTSASYTCGARCNSDKDCWKGGYVECGKCNLYRGTKGYKTCYNDQPFEHDYFPNAGSCSKRCKRDRDCQKKGRGYNPCGKCGKYAGTQMEGLCYQPDDNERHLLDEDMSRDDDDEGRNLLRGST